MVGKRGRGHLRLRALAVAGLVLACAAGVAAALPLSAATAPTCTDPLDCPTTQQPHRPPPDTTPPQLYGNLPDLRVEATGPDGAPVSYATPSAFDPESGALTASCSPPSGTTFPLGATLVTCSATDGAGNTSVRTFTVTVVDTTPPSLRIPAQVHLRSWFRTGRKISYPASAVDLVDGPVAITCSPPPRSVIPAGFTILVICVAVDSHGNKATGSFPLTVSFG